MAVQTEETKIALMAKDIEYIKKSQDRIELSIAGLEGRFVTQKENADHITASEKRFMSLEGQICETNKTLSFMQKQVWVATGGLAVLIFFIEFFIK